MPTSLVPHKSIAALAAKVEPTSLQILRRIQRDGFIINQSDLGATTIAALQQLTELGLVDAGYEGSTRDKPLMWVSNGNGSRVLTYKTGLRSGPHYEVFSGDLARWLEQQGAERWWNVDGDPLLTGRINFPCPADELATELRKINLPLLVQAKKENTRASGQTVSADELNDIVGRLPQNIRFSEAKHGAPGGGDLLLYLCWKDSTDEWLLIEDSETAQQMRTEIRATAADSANARKE
jgi:hypothetical protein